MGLGDIFGKLPINGSILGKVFIRDQIRQQAAPYINALGPHRIETMITQGQNFSDLAPEVLGEQGLEMIKAQLAKYSWLNAMLTDEDIRRILPPWFTELVARHGEKGQAWYFAQISWLRSLFPPGS